MIAFLRAISGRRELLQLRRQRQRWEADQAKLAELLELEAVMDVKLPFMQSQIANCTYQNALMLETLRLVQNARGCKCKILVQKLFNRLGIQ